MSGVKPPATPWFDHFACARSAPRVPLATSSPYETSEHEALLALMPLAPAAIDTS